MRLTFDAEAQVAYVHLIEPDGRRLTTEEISDSLFIDRGPDGEAVGIELLNIPDNEIAIERHGVSSDEVAPA